MGRAEEVKSCELLHSWLTYLNLVSQPLSYARKPSGSFVGEGQLILVQDAMKTNSYHESRDEYTWSWRIWLSRGCYKAELWIQESSVNRLLSPHLSSYWTSDPATCSLRLFARPSLLLLHSLSLFQQHHPCPWRLPVCKTAVAAHWA